MPASNAANKNWYEKNRDYVLAKAWLKTINSQGVSGKEIRALTTVKQSEEVRKAKKRAYYEQVSREKMMAAYREKKAQNPLLNSEKYAKRSEYYKAWAKRWRSESPELAKAKDAAQRLKSVDKRAASTKVWREGNKEKIKAAYQAWCKANPEVVRTHNANRRAKLRNAHGSHTVEEIKALYQLQQGKCVVCTKGLGDRYDVDHIQPLSKSGSNDVKNLQLLCVYCNRSKHAKDPLDFMQSRGFLL